ncbi:hypothetical protein [Gallaecimonas xiamenensis]|uniref:Uncharacterized protein n=1 Tax=Gallaecimonas xiamenensis 3-C-1 TaxID=745411 RepID=K2JSM0_9GAMM|nr:hypothetical protein [Gallaecimonas xiamenensis]EKE68105.1 hypothetical protein B3C1_17452 [Gallaecimonas xiamenensis 3-C-1]
MLIALKIAIFISCIRYLQLSGRPGRTAFIYAGSWLLLGLLWIVMNASDSESGLLVLGIFGYDLALGFALFWLLDRFAGRTVLFLGTIALWLVVDKFLQVFLVLAWNA